MPFERGNRPCAALTMSRVTLGDLAAASFVLCAASGAILAASFDPSHAANSIAAWLLANPAATYLRNIHYWTAQFCLVLTALHIWDHFHAATERTVERGVWLRLALCLPVLAFLMLSGFLLRGDADARQAQRILDTAIGRIPMAGRLAATLFFGAGEGLQVVYAQHAATATLIILLVIIEHARRLWPRWNAVAAAGIAAGAVSVFLSPGLHDGLDPAVKGPWYFLGLQEILHWTPQVTPVIGAGVAGMLLFAAVPFLPARWAARFKRALLAGAFAYVLLCGIGLFFRGTNWSLTPVWPHGSGDLRAGMIFRTARIPSDKIQASLPVVLGHAEGCLLCHPGIQGLGDAHRPESIGCASCHGGDVFTLDKDRAHAAMIAVPGNLADAARSCGQADCHSAIVGRVDRSIMTTFAGVISTDRRVFGEPADARAAPPHVNSLGTGPADTHLRQLCASCHIGRNKAAWGPVTEESRGGGCNACHLSYSEEAARALRRYQAGGEGAKSGMPQVHPALSVAVDDSHCFGCHSRSGRIATNYEGWHELNESPAPGELAGAKAAPPQFRLLADGRYFVRVSPDVHQERGLSCIDCHTAADVMGRGAVVARKGDQVSISCRDCHARKIAAAPAAAMDPEARKILSLRKWELGPKELLGAAGTGNVLLNVRIADSRPPRMLRKSTGRSADLRAPLPACDEGAGHGRLTCNSCHSAWAPRCPACHTSFDPSAGGFDHLAQSFARGAWTETSGKFSAALPTLGVCSLPPDSGHSREVIDTFIPGMILTVDGSSPAGAQDGPIFRRLYARAFSHTIRREARSCESCHNDPVALGLGSGTLAYEISGSAGRWRFTPKEEPSYADGLPADAWIGFQQTRSGMASTRDDVRPFTAEEQRRILRVGACLTCHRGNSPEMRRSITDFQSLLARRSKRCILPVWD